MMIVMKEETNKYDKLILHAFSISESILLGIRTCKSFHTIERSRELVLNSTFKKDMKERDLVVLFNLIMNFMLL